LVDPNTLFVFGGVVLFEAQHLSELFGRLDHQVFHLVVGNATVARLTEQRRWFAGVKVLQEPVPKGRSLGSGLDATFSRWDRRAWFVALAACIISRGSERHATN
jgi:hypothetical protein